MDFNGKETAENSRQTSKISTHPPRFCFRQAFASATLLVIGLTAGCGPEDQSKPSASSGQVRQVSASSMSAYAAARFADQVTFGATPEVVNAIAAQGPGAWIDAQMALPAVSLETPAWAISFDFAVADDTPKLASQWLEYEFINKILSSPDQLRMRVAWALFQYIPAVDAPYATAEYKNLLWRSAFGNYRDLLRGISIHPTMGKYLNNSENRAVSSECLSCAPNENYARELLQLFSLGVVQLESDGTVIRDASGKPKETYTQKDVEELARALTGWSFAPGGKYSNFVNAGKNMVPDPWDAAHDRNSKIVMGKVFPAGKDAPQELETALDILMAHPNIAPFVALRLIQHLVTSDPSPQYIQRVSAAFRNNGNGVAGDMKAVVKAVLLDPEARAGDIPGKSPIGFGKLREPFLWWTAALRGLGCTKGTRDPNNGYTNYPGAQHPLRPPSVFSFYLPTDRAPGSNLLAPEQKLLGSGEFMSRLSELHWVFRQENASSYATHCKIDALAQAFATSPQVFVDEVSKRWFRGAMPPTLRSNLLSLATAQNWSNSQEAAMTLTGIALATPYFGGIE